jgi:hypothetical protein
VGEYVTLNKTFYSIPSKQETAAAAPVTSKIFPYSIPEGRMY